MDSELFIMRIKRWNIKDSGKMEFLKVREKKIIMMVMFIKEISQMENGMVRVNTLGLMEGFIKENLKMGSWMEKVS